MNFFENLFVYHNFLNFVAVNDHSWDRKNKHKFSNEVVKMNNVGLGPSPNCEGATPDIEMSEVAEGSTRQVNPSARVWWKIVIGDKATFTHYSIIAVFSRFCKKYCFQKEISENGFCHFQCLIGCESKKTKLTVLKILTELGGKENIQIKPSDKHFVSYCSKQDTRVAGPWTKGFAHLPQSPVECLEYSELYGWQKEIVDIVTAKPDDRAIYWYWDANGGKGKTALCRHLMVMHSAFMFRGGSNDMCNRIIKSEEEVRIAIMHLSRQQEKFVSYQTIEEIKDGIVVSGKYEGGQKCFNCPHVLIFANFPPDEEKLSADRWHISRLDEGENEWNAIFLAN